MQNRGRRIGLALAAALGVAAASAETRELRFVREGEPVRRVEVASLRAACGEREIEVRDPYYGRTKRFLACPLRFVLERGFGPLDDAFTTEHLLLRALDGYTRGADARELLADEAWLAFEDADRVRRGERGFDPIDRRQVDPAPSYLIWSGPDQNDPHRFPWPYQLASFEIARFEDRFPHTVPREAAAGSAPWRGFAIFRAQCASCHAINGEGGRIGPELNVPRSIVEYRPVEQIKQYVRNPAAFRYTSMPSHLDLSEEDLDDLIAYFRQRAAHKRDPGASGERGG